MKTCSRCGYSKSLGEFYPRPRAKDGLRAECKACGQAARRSGYGDHEKERNREYARQNSAQRVAAAKAWREANTDKVAAYGEANRDRYLWHARARKAALENRVPPWANHDAIREAYEVAAILSRGGVTFEVDHVVPLRHSMVAGLHCEANLQVIPHHANRSKGNRYWPDMP